MPISCSGTLHVSAWVFRWWRVVAAGGSQIRPLGALAMHRRSRRLHEMKAPSAPAIALVQGVFYIATGIWAVVDLDSFMAVTGPKVDHWLVKTVGLLVAVIGAALVLAWRRRRVTGEILLLAVGSALCLAAIDIIYVSNGTIRPVYLLDAAAEVGLALGWGLAARSG